LIRVEYNVMNTVDNEGHVPPASNEVHIQLPNAYGGPDALTKLLSDSIGEALTDLIGTRAREAIYDYIERNHSIARSEIPDHLDELFTLFERNFGVASKTVIGRVIAKKVYTKLDLEFYSIPHFEFIDYLEKIKTRLAREVLDRAKSAKGRLA
jgi:hypothetical protein